MNKYERQQELGPTTERQWIRHGGIAAIVGSVLYIGASFVGLLIAADPGTTPYLATSASFGLGGVLLLLGALGVHLRYGDEYGRLGIVGAAIVGFGFLLLSVGAIQSLAYTGPAVETTPGGQFLFMGIALGALGSALLGVALWRAGVVRTTIVLVLATPVVLFLGGEAIVTAFGINGDAGYAVFVVVFGLAWTALGYQIQAGSEDSQTPPIQTGSE